MIEEIAGGILRFFGRVFLEFFAETLIKGTGYSICKRFTKHNPNPDGFAVCITGILFWIVVGIGVYSIYSTMSNNGNL